MTAQLKVLLSITATLTVMAPFWVWLGLPNLFPEIACALPRLDGTSVDAWGSPCQNTNMSPAIGLGIK